MHAENKYCPDRADRLPFTTNLSEEAIDALCKLEAKQAKGSYTNIIHVMPNWDDTRVGFFLDRKLLLKAWRYCNKIWQNNIKVGRIFENELILEKMTSNFPNQQPHIKEALFRWTRPLDDGGSFPTFSRLALLNLNERVIPVEYQYVLMLCADRSNTSSEDARSVACRPLINPFDTVQMAHSLLGGKVVSLDDVIENYKRTVKAHFEDLITQELFSRVLHVAIDLYGEKRRKNGELFVIHPIESTTMLIKMGVSDHEILFAELFHDLEDVDFTKFGLSNFRPITKEWVKDLQELLKRELYSTGLPRLSISRIATLVVYASKPEFFPDGIPIPKEVQKNEMHDTINMRHANRVMKVADSGHNAITADALLSIESLDSLISRIDNKILKFLGKKSPSEPKLTKDQIKIEKRCYNFLKEIQRQLGTLRSEKFN